MLPDSGLVALIRRLREAARNQPQATLPAPLESLGTNLQDKQHQ
jgi:hypothetical protein